MNAKNQSFVKDIFDREGAFTFSLVWKKSQTWGRTCGLYFNGRKLDLASGCGYAKDTAMIESAVNACTGEWASLGGNNLWHIHNNQAELFAAFELVQDYAGNMEDGYTFRRVVNELSPAPDLYIIRQEAARRYVVRTVAGRHTVTTGTLEHCQGTILANVADMTADLGGQS